MNLTKLTFFSHPIVFAALVLVNSPAEASVSTSLSRPDPVSLTAAHHAVAVVVASPSARPVIPTGCSCARCTQTDQLQGKFPVL